MLQYSVALPKFLDSKNLLNSTPLKINLQDGKSKVFVFLSSKCPCSHSHLETILQLSRDFNAFPFYAIHSNANEDVQEALKYFQDKKFPFPVLRDEGAKIADEFKALKTPHAFIVNGQGEIIYSGGVTNSAHAPNATKHYLKEALRNILNGKLPDPREQRALGCIISRP